MHRIIDIKLDELTKVEGAASLDIKIRNGKVEHAHYKITESKRFYTKAIEGKSIMALPQLLSRICGTCSNAHLMCSIEACEKALGITPSAQTMLLRHLTMYGLNVRDHPLHLYLFVMPDIFGVDSIFDLDENDPEQNQLLHDAFEMKSAGNHLATIIAGRSVHAMNPTIGGYLHFPTQKEVKEAIKKLEAVRPAALRLIKVFEKVPWSLDRNTNYMALVADGMFTFLEGEIVASNGEVIKEKDFAKHLERVVLPYSQASAYKHENESYMVGALARLNIDKANLHPKTKKSLGKTLDRFPSTNIFDNNLAQAIEVLHCIDHSLEILKGTKFKKEAVIKKPFRKGVGVGVIEAPRGLLYHMYEIDDKGIVQNGEIVVPTGQNQINIEEDIHLLVNKMLPDKPSKEKIIEELEKLIRAYDPCMSCAVHFLKVNWDVA